MFSKIRWRLRAVETLPHLYIAVSFSVYTLAICPLHLADLQTSERSKSKTS